MDNANKMNFELFDNDDDYIKSLIAEEPKDENIII
jgi:hypothetical protein